MDLAIFKKSVIYGSSLIVGMHVLRTNLLEARKNNFRTTWRRLLRPNFGTFSERDRESYLLGHRRLGAAI